METAPNLYCLSFSLSDYYCSRAGTLTLVLSKLLDSVDSSSMNTRILLFAIAALLPSLVFGISVPYQVYDNEFLDPSYFVAKKFPSSTIGAQQTVVEWAKSLAAQGPCCDGQGRAASFRQQTRLYELGALCNYVDRDGQFNPDRLLVNDTSAFQAMSDAVFYNTVAWVITGSSQYALNAAHFLDTWFINPATAQTPNLKYAQMHRGPNGQIGSHTGLLDFHQMAKIASAILILREGKSTSWTSALDSKMISWTKTYITWVTTNSVAHQEQIASNNHGTFFYNQLASLYIIVNDKTSASNSLKTYFSTLYKAQIEASGEQVGNELVTMHRDPDITSQPFEATNAKIGKYLGLDFWNTTTTHGATIKTATDYTMNKIHLDTADGDGPIWELYPSIVATGSIYGSDHYNGTYARFLAKADNTYPSKPYFLFNQPFSNSGLAVSGRSARSRHPARAWSH
ncbi:hypothetical protein HWV62_25691 [Athelia sp. TMB]|nr:hypothetical protein HWV62_25691 [Athelia sp. TMB]